jgi:hypothetical protein
MKKGGNTCKFRLRNFQQTKASGYRHFLYGGFFHSAIGRITLVVNIPERLAILRKCSLLKQKSIRREYTVCTATILTGDSVSVYLLPPCSSGYSRKEKKKKEKKKKIFDITFSSRGDEVPRSKNWCIQYKDICMYVHARKYGTHPLHVQYVRTYILTSPPVSSNKF